MGSNPSGQEQKENGAYMKEISSQNNFEVLSILEEQMLSVLEEGEVPQPQNQTSEEVKGPAEPNLGTPADGNSPTYTEMEKKRNLWTIMAHPMKIPLRGLPKKVKNIIRCFKRKKQNILRGK